MITKLALVYVTDTDPGISRRRYGKGYRYLDSSGRVINRASELQRIRQLAVPPAYKNVWICPLANGHIQATGLDDAGRKQYRYHADWTESQSSAKFDRLVDFAVHLPRIRRRIDRLLCNPRPDDIFGKEVATAALVRLIDQTAMRIGGRSRTAQGATTLLMRNISYGNGGLKLRYVAKGGKKVQSSVNDRKLQRTLEKIHDLPGKRLFQYIGVDGAVHPLDSGDVNNWLKDVTGMEDISAKMFRTWHGSVAALGALRHAPKPGIKIACQAAADVLCNTPAIARKSYVHPKVLDLAQTGAPDDLAKIRAPRVAGLTAGENRLLAVIG